MANRRIRRKNDDAPGQDSFLDVVANLVGILIILVMVVGARAKDAWTATSATNDGESVVELSEAIEVSKDTTEALRTDIHKISKKVKLQEAAVAARKKERDQIQLLVTRAERELATEKSQLNDTDRSQLDLRGQVDAAQRSLSELIQTRSAIESSASAPTVLEHVPTPMARTVFGKEVHFRLLNGRLAYVPLEELVDQMKDEIRVKAERLRESPQVSETVGPLSGFHLRYVLQLTQRVRQTQFGFVGFYLIPTGQQLGEPLAQALRSNSHFARRIGGLNPDTTTITVWVYPDSFGEFFELRRELLRRGFLTASWPMPEGQPISGGPNGRRSVVQ